MSLFYEVDEEVSRRIRDCVSREDWYELTGTLNLEDSLSFDAEQSLSSWIHLLGSGLQGDFRTPPDDTGEPELVFFGANSLATLLEVLRSHDESFYREKLNTAESSVDIWLFVPLCDFIQGAVRRGKAVILLLDE